jgi:hypothetical protein
VRRKALLFFGLTTFLAGGITYAVNQPSLECKSIKEITDWHWDRAETANSLSTETYLSSIFGDIQNPDIELKYRKSIYELRRIEHLYKIAASKNTLENQECFSDSETIKAKIELETQKSLQGYFAE